MSKAQAVMCVPSLLRRFCVVWLRGSRLLLQTLDRVGEWISSDVTIGRRIRGTVVGALLKIDEEVFMDACPISKYWGTRLLESSSGFRVETFIGPLGYSVSGSGIRCRCFGCNLEDFASLALEILVFSCWD